MSTLVVNRHTPVDASSAPVSMALPTGASGGDEISAEKYDGSTNAVTITGSIRGVAAQTVTLSLVRETVSFRADDSGSWWPISDHKTLSSLDGRFASAPTGTPTAGVSVPVAKAGGGTQWGSGTPAPDARINSSAPTVRGYLAGLFRDAAGRVPLGVTTDGTIEASKLSVLRDIALAGALKLGGAKLNQIGDNVAGDALALGRDANGRAAILVRKTGAVTLKLATDSYIPPNLTAGTEVVAARGTQTDLATRLGHGLTAYGTPAGYALNEARLRWTRMRTRQILLGDTGNPQLDIAVCGDSYSQLRTRWTGPFWQALKAVYGDAGVGWVGFSNPSNVSLQNGSVRSDTTLTVTGSWTPTYYGVNGPDLGEMASSTVGDQIVVAFPAGQTSAKLFFVPAAGSSVSYQWGSGTVTTLATDTGTGTQAVTLNPPAGGDTTLTVKVVAGTPRLCGVDLRNGNTGVRVHKIAATGSSAQQWAAVNATSWGQGIAALRPQLVIVMHGANDQTSGTAPTAFGGYLATIVANFNTALGALTYDRMFVMQPENQRGLPTTMASYAAAALPVADAVDAAYIDLQSVFGINPGDYASTSARPWFASDNLHPDPTTGGRVITDAVLRPVTQR